MNDQKPKPSFAPFYCALYPELATIAREHGYALAIHGSLQRDFDLVCIPWVPIPCNPPIVVAAITDRYVMRLVGEPERKEHDRLVFTLAVMGECFLDLSFMPVVVKP
jgi:hypothetical protein